MWKSAAERQREQRAQLKSNEENYSKYLEKDRNWKKKARDTQKQQTSPTKWNKHLAKERKRIQNYPKKLERHYWHQNQHLLYRLHTKHLKQLVKQ